MRRLATAALVSTLVTILVSDLVVGCGGAQKPTGGVDADDAVIKLEVTGAGADAAVGDASVWIDGRYVATVSELKAGVAIDAGTYRFAFERPDYLASFVEVVVAPAEHKTVAATLYQRLP